MALLHVATLTPSKIELLAAWLPSRAWSQATTSVRQLGAYRFDDPAGEVGVEAFLLQTDDSGGGGGGGGGSILHVPVTYRAAPLAGAQASLLGTMEHSVLGTRWVYDGCADPVWAQTLATAILTGSPQAELTIEVDGRMITRDQTVTVQGSGTPGTPVPEIDAVTFEDGKQTTTVRAGGLELVIVREVGADVVAGQTLTGRWGAGAGQAVLAGVRP